MKARWQKSAAAFAGLGASVLLLVGIAVHAQDGANSTVREFTINGSKYAYSPPRIEVKQNDLVKVSFTAADIAHSFTVDQYRIVKRAGAGQTVVFEFRADQPGTFTYYCNLLQDDRCRNMKGQLVVK